MSDDLHPSPQAAFQRGRLLQQQHRLSDAIDCYKQAIALDAEHTPSYLMLALCWMEEESTAAQALDAARRAVALEPEDAFAHSVLALAHNANARDGQTAAMRAALQEAQQAAALDPDSDFAHAVVARLHLRLREYPQAERSARMALSLDTENTMAAEVLSAALLLQKKDGDNQDLIRYQLERDPEDDAAHTSAGWQALMTGDHKVANQHFMEALRLNPMNESARMGLVESYRARSWFYSAFLSYVHWMNQFTEGKQQAIMIGGFIGYKVLSGYLKTVAPFWASVLIGLWLLFALWSHLARGVGTFMVLLDRFARMSLKRREFWEGAVVGGLLCLAIGALAMSLIREQAYSGYTAAALLFAAVANAAAFTNDHHIGRHVYNVAGALAGLGAVYQALALVANTPLPFASLMGLTAVIIGVAISWLRPFRLGYA